MIKTEGIVISRRNSYNDDVFLTIFTKKFGVIDAVAKRAKSFRSPINPSTRAFVCADFIMKPQSPPLIVNADIIYSNLGILDDIESISSASYIVEIVKKTLPEGLAEADIYDLTRGSMKVLNDKAAQCSIVRCHFVCNLCSMLGILPDLSVCNRCGSAGSDDDRLSPRDGRICRECADSEYMPADPRFFRFIDYLLKVRSARLAHTVAEAELIKKASDFSEALLRHHLGIENIKSKELFSL